MSAMVKETKATHTPGPWTVASFVGVDRPVTDAGLNEVEEANCQINDLNRQDRYAEAEQVGEANRQLIGAAPDLLAACEQQLRALDGPPGDFDTMLAAHRAMAAAVAKAKP